MEELLKSIEENEGFRGFQYNDTLGYPTIGFGTKLPLSKEEAELILKFRLEKMINLLEKTKPEVKDFPQSIKEVLYEMAYQMGVNGLLKFKKMFKALEEQDYKKASLEGLDSRWAEQTPNRAKKLMKRVADYSEIA